MEQQVFVTTLAGNASSKFADGIGTGATFNFPNGVAVDTSGNVYVADTNNHRIRRITSGGVVSTLAGNVNIFVDGIGTGAGFFNPYGVAVDTSGNVYVADSSNHRIRKITSGGVVSTLAGNVSIKCADGIGTGASFSYPYGVAVDTSGNVYVADASNHRIRRLIFAGGCRSGTECIDPVSPLPCPKNTRCMPCSSVRFLVFSVTFAILCS